MVLVPVEGGAGVLGGWGGVKGGDLKDDLTLPASLLFTPALRTFVVSPDRGRNLTVPSINLP